MRMYKVKVKYTTKSGIEKIYTYDRPHVLKQRDRVFITKQDKKDICELFFEKNYKKNQLSKMYQITLYKIKKILIAERGTDKRKIEFLQTINHKDLSLKEKFLITKLKKDKNYSKKDLCITFNTSYYIINKILIELKLIHKLTYTEKFLLEEEKEKKRIKQEKKMNKNNNNNIKSIKTSKTYTNETSADNDTIISADVSNMSNYIADDVSINSNDISITDDEIENTNFIVSDNEIEYFEKNEDNDDNDNEDDDDKTDETNIKTDKHKYYIYSDSDEDEDSDNDSDEEYNDKYSNCFKYESAPIDAIDDFYLDRSSLMTEAEYYEIHSR